MSKVSELQCHPVTLNLGRSTILSCSRYVNGPIPSWATAPAFVCSPIIFWCDCNVRTWPMGVSREFSYIDCRSRRCRCPRGAQDRCLARARHLPAQPVQLPLRDVRHLEDSRGQGDHTRRSRSPARCDPKTRCALGRLLRRRAAAERTMEWVGANAAIGGEPGYPSDCRITAQTSGPGRR